MKTLRWLGIGSALLALGWLLFLALDDTLAGMLASRFGQAVLRIGEGKITDPALFIKGRLFEIMLLTSMAMGCAAGMVLINIGLRAHARLAAYRWLWGALAGFVLLNVWLGVAGRTNVFWGCMWQGKNTHNLARFNFKKILLAETQGKAQAILMGSSQVRAQIEENLLNQLLTNKVWTTELHYPGSRAYDLLLTLRRLPQGQFSYVVCYLSESYFYLNTVSEAFPYFFQVCDWREGFQLGAVQFSSSQQLTYAFLGQLMPLFRYREVMAQWTLGPDMTQMQQVRYNAKLETDLTKRAQEVAKTYQRDQQSEFQKRAFAQFVKECGHRGVRLILIAGQVNPRLSQHFDPALRSEMMTLLQDTQRQNSWVTLLMQEEIRPQTAADYEDLTHVTTACQDQFTRSLAQSLRALLQ